ncbi:membrane-bound PQQ-dependent dehydrogenase, glucose/quinate/shikimate family [Bartonella sp. HY329]|uniref:membrane-bound PQQ-dependent dehydrogenase, glucose/quinate/shikimate family n=1 Tax=unclassified Bartonella TaxID=2645622 RepID=UPI0021C9F4DE|nr:MULTISPECIES: membrane-bound PQQ-dependent dehydrogenase, glucose/quinate/shikimate family [unclassified Bartonella]UXM94556.1 membrane-bound PQQ-dependent dehydrogenase, glucose/quinate/shikimate family [Bartonella sp. HY329]UXN08880.1 membrane-bound PQQ-dependent dehydrogenase, glucose/quinate/shikimate family [Bartonella sp. HY328]
MNHKNSRFGTFLLRIIAFVMAIMGLYLAIMGGYLAINAGSPYYIIAGLVSLIAAFLLWRVNIFGAWLYLILMAGTIIWALWEKGTNFWGFFPRSFTLLVMTCLVFIFFPLARQWSSACRLRRIFWPIGAVIGVFSAFIFLNLFKVHYLVNDPQAASGKAALAMSGTGDWTHYARNGEGRRFAPFNQINQDNVKDLEVAWTFQTGDIAKGQAEDQNTPLQIGDTVYACSPHDIVSALDVDSGEKRWSFDPKATSPLWQRCRSLAYADLDKNTITLAPQTNSIGADENTIIARNTDCRQRIILGTINTRLIAIDAKTGAKCSSFGKNGEVDLRQGMGEVDPGYYMQTSGPTVIENGMIIIAGWVWDNMSLGEPSGVVRAFSAEDGSLIWAWDLGNPAITKEPPQGETYTRGTPNVWTTPAYDEKLGLVYLPTGNETPDYWGGKRTKAADEYNSSIVAVDYHTGKEKWKFQTTHHDLWDYDIPAQPALYDVPDEKGNRIPAIIQVTKRGEIFMLDRRDGTPIAEVQEKNVPQTGVAAGDYVSPTQPYSVGMPQIRYPEFKESDMWGMTMFDQLLCRIDFKKMNYQGDFTPPSVQTTIQYPSNLGGMNWGSVSIDESKGYLIINDIRLAMAPQLIPHDETSDGMKAGDGHIGYSPQKGTPFGVTTNYFLSALGVPCNTPPFGTLTAVDLASRKIVWQVPLGTTEDSGPMGLKIGLPIKAGLPSLGGPLATAGNLIFYSGTQDYYLRAFNSATGAEIWKSRLPVGGQSTPMTYISPKTGKQYIVLTASGARGQPDRGDYIIAYRLKEKN